MNNVYLSLEWAKMDRGSMTEAEAAASMCSRLPERLHEQAHLLVDRWDRPILPVPGMAELVRELKEAGYGVYLLSNASYRQHEYWPRVPGSEYFDGTLISADVKLVKPCAEIYELLYSTFGLIPGECLFIDDSAPNIEGAERTGMPGIVFHGDADELRRLYDTIHADLVAVHGDSSYNNEKETNYGDVWYLEDGNIIISVMITGSQKALQFAYISPTHSTDKDNQK